MDYEAVRDERRSALRAFFNCETMTLYQGRKRHKNLSKRYLQLLTPTIAGLAVPNEDRDRDIGRENCISVRHDKTKNERPKQSPRNDSLALGFPRWTLCWG